MKRHLKNAYFYLRIKLYKILYWFIAKAPFVDLYQPLYGLQKERKDTTRSCEDRWNAFAPYLDTTGGSVLDIGSNIGYFSFKCAEKNYVSYGHEANALNCLVANAAKYKNEVQDCFFVQAMITPDFVKKMPHFDVVINLSVFHHWVKIFGKDEAQEMMRGLAAKTKAMIFETGQSNEIGSQWPEILSFMGDEPEMWTARFLKDIGFNNVKNLGTFDTGLTNTKRTLFFASKK